MHAPVTISSLFSSRVNKGYASTTVLEGYPTFHCVAVVGEFRKGDLPAYLIFISSVDIQCCLALTRIVVTNPRVATMVNDSNACGGGGVLTETARFADLDQTRVRIRLRPHTATPPSSNSSGGPHRRHFSQPESSALVSPTSWNGWTSDVAVYSASSPADEQQSCSYPIERRQTHPRRNLSPVQIRVRRGGTPTTLGNYSIEHTAALSICELGSLSESSMSLELEDHLTVRRDDKSDDSDTTVAVEPEEAEEEEELPSFALKERVDGDCKLEDFMDASDRYRRFIDKVRSRSKPDMYMYWP